ncbi:hypothetical protein HID58_090193 [Brassica napus]|uniref:AAA+ ATPase At3g28540-like C-terminal domain-containing protein n=1 Tax=Brassica napus TaxID=3708 RepID=A0ABQ7X238_BRANA|nr:hypothetical protein HID58_090193 [Brassica napus]
MQRDVITPAQVAEELMKSEDADMALEGLVSVLETMRSKADDQSSQVFVATSMLSPLLIFFSNDLIMVSLADAGTEERKSSTAILYTCKIWRWNAEEDGAKESKTRR